MASYITKKDLGASLSRYQEAILEAMNDGFARNEKRMDKLEMSINRLTNTLDSFLKRLTDFEDEFTILKAEVGQMKTIFKKKFGIDVSLLGK